MPMGRCRSIRVWCGWIPPPRWKYAALIQAESIACICRVPPFDCAPESALNFYGDLVLPLAQSTTLEDYLADTSDGPATPESAKAWQVIWQRLRGTSFTSERLQPAMFIHFGTSREYWVAADVNLQREFPVVGCRTRRLGC